MTEPRTEAGRALLAHPHPESHDFAERVARVEAEAAARLAELEAALRDVLDFHKLDDPECASCWTAHALLDTRSPESKCRRRAGPATEAPVNEEAPTRPQPGVTT